MDRIKQTYSVWDTLGGMREIESDMSHDEAIGFARGLEYAGILCGGSFYKPIVRCGSLVCWPEDRYGEIIND